MADSNGRDVGSDDDDCYSALTKIEELKRNGKFTLKLWYPQQRQYSKEEDGTVRICRQEFTLEDAIGSHACSLEASMHVTNAVPLGRTPLLYSHRKQQR
jgi:hypothetical protein